MMKVEDVPMDPLLRSRYITDLASQLEQVLIRHIGGVTPKGQPFFSMEGPVPDPSHSSPLMIGAPAMVFVLSYSVPVETDDLPADCSAYVAMGGGTIVTPGASG